MWFAVGFQGWEAAVFETEQVLGWKLPQEGNCRIDWSLILFGIKKQKQKKNVFLLHFN